MYKLMNLDGEFLSRLPAFFPLLIFVRIRTHKVAEYGSNLDPDPQH